MGLCSTLFKICLYTFLTLSAVLVYFHIECIQESERSQSNRFNEDYDPEQTDCVAELPFAKPDTGLIETVLGPEFMLKQWTPCALVKLISHTRNILFGSLDQFGEHKIDMKNVTIWDVTKYKPGTFKETGFTYIHLDEEPQTQNWRYESEDIHLFVEQLEPHIRALYPNVKKMILLSSLVRGGSQFGDQPAAPAPHLDYFQVHEERKEFYKKYPLPVFFGNTKNEPNALMGKLDTEEYQYEIMLGVWKPLHPEKVCDIPLAVMDARTFKKENQIQNHLSLNIIFGMFYNLNGAISYSPDQRWYYYPFQSTKDVLIFHQHSKNQWMANPHTAFINRNCPHDTESRQSAEIRIALMF